MIPDKVIKTRRKTIALQVTEYAELIVRAPYRAEPDEIQSVIAKHATWIHRKKEEMLSKDPKFNRKKYVNGEGFPYLGRYYRLRIIKDLGKPLTLTNEFLLSADRVPFAGDEIVKWYNEQAKEFITKRANIISKSTALKYASINITNAEQRWGSCSKNGQLNFTWRLIMAPVSVIDYVVLHEMVHIVVKNHPKTFWNKVEAYMPDYRERNEWLKENGYLLRL